MTVTGLTGGSGIPPDANKIGTLSDLTPLKNELANLVVGMNSGNMTQTWEKFEILNAKMETLIDSLLQPAKGIQRTNMTQLQIAMGGIKKSTEKFNNAINDPTKYSFSQTDLQLFLQEYKTAKECVQKIGLPNETTAIDSPSQKPFEFFSNQIHSIISNIQTTLADKDQSIAESIDSMEMWARQTWDQDQAEYAESEKSGSEPRQDSIDKIKNYTKILKKNLEQLKNISLILYPKDPNVISDLNSMLDKVNALKELAENDPRDHADVEWENAYNNSDHEYVDSLKNYQSPASRFNILKTFNWEG